MKPKSRAAKTAANLDRLYAVIQAETRPTLSRLSAAMGLSISPVRVLLCYLVADGRIRIDPPEYPGGHNRIAILPEGGKNEQY